MSDQEIISTNSINMISSRQVMGKGKKLGDYWSIHNQILQSDIIRIVWQTVKRISNEILGAKGLITETQLFEGHLALNQG